MAVILTVELTLAVTLYTYKDHLTSGLRKGLNQSLHNYGPSAVMQSADFDAMQENVRAPLMKNKIKIDFKFFPPISSAAAEIKTIETGTV